MKGKRLLILGAAFALGLSACANSATMVRRSPLKAVEDATMTAGTNGSECEVNGNNGIKVGTSSKGGDMSITVPSGATKLYVYAAAWKGVTGLSLNITPNANISPSSISLTADDGVSSNSPFTLSGAEESFRYEFTLSNLTSSETFKFTTSIAKRFVIWGAQYDDGNGGAPSSSDPSSSSEEIKYTVVYDANGADSGIVPVDNTEYASGDSVTVLGNTGNLTKQGYVFDGWNTVADGSGTSYNANGTFSISKNETLYAMWAEDTTGVAWVLTPISSLLPSDTFIIAGNNGDSYAMSNNGGTTSAPSAVEINPSNGKVTGAVNESIKWNIGGNATDGYEFYPNGSEDTWLYCTNTNNGVRVGTNTNKTFIIDSESGYLKHVSTGRYVGIYNSADWRCYTSSGGNIAEQTFAFYRKTKDRALSSIQLSGSYPTTFNQDDAFSSEGLVVTANYEGGDQEEVTSRSILSGYNLLNAGQQTVTVSYTEGLITKSASYTINVVGATMYNATTSSDGLELEGQVSVREGNALNLTIKTTAEKYTLPSTLEVTMNNVAYNGFTYNPSTGEFNIAQVTGDVVISGTCGHVHGLWENDPYTVEEAILAIDAGSGINDAYVTGVVSKIVTEYDPTYGNISYNISDDGSVSSTQLEAFRGKNINGANFKSADDVKVGATVVIFGNLTNYKGTYEFAADNRLVSYNPPADTPNTYLISASSVATLHGSEESSPKSGCTDSVTFSELGLTSGTQYSDPFDIGKNGATITFAGGGNDGKYYDTGTAIRTYSNGTITVSAPGTITLITFTWSSNDKPAASYYSVDSGEYDIETGVWTGSASSVTLKNTATSGHWRLQKVEAEYEGVTVSVSNVAMRFGVTLSKSNWDNITSEWNISNYGVMLLKQTTLNSYGFSSVEAAYRANDAEKPVTILSKGSGDVPYLDENNNYLFTVKVNVKEVNYGVVFCAAPFIVIDDEYYFLDEKQYSVNSLAQHYLSNDGSNLSKAALNVLAGN